MEDFINWILDNKDTIINIVSICGTAIFAVLNCVLTLIKTRKSRIQKISNEESIEKLTSEVKKRLLHENNESK